MNWYDAMEEAYKKGQKDALKWISVSEKLPEEYVSVLIHVPEEAPLPTVKEGYLAHGCWVTKMWVFRNEVTHWMPMPEPPKEEHNG